MHLQEVLFASRNPTVSRQIAKLNQEGKIRKIAPRIYSSNLTDEAEIIIRRNLFIILGNLYPGSLLSHRSALEFKPTPAGHIFLTYTYSKKIDLQGITLRFIKGHKPIEGDNPLSGELYASQLERALLENLEVSRKPDADSKILPPSAIEERLEQIIRVNGDMALNAVRDKARLIAEVLNMHNEFRKLDKLIGALLKTKPSKILSSPLAVARAFGNPYDPVRILLFEKLFTALKQQDFANRPEKNTAGRSFTNFAFFEAYFSNYIEGTVFELEEAKQIVETQIPLPARDEDSHDILGTYMLVSSEQEMKITPSTSDELLDILLYRHKILLGARLSKKPGAFKDKNNRAGETFFVDKMLVRGTLIKGFDFYNALTHPFAKAAYIMFLISEVHPFLDGNGRIARVMMNAELTNKHQARIIIPTVYREDYMLALRKLTRQQDPGTYIRMLQRAHAFSETITGKNMNAMEKHLIDCNAFQEPDKAKLKITPPM